MSLPHGNWQLLRVAGTPPFPPHTTLLNHPLLFLPLWSTCQAKKKSAHSVARNRDPSHFHQWGHQKKPFFSGKKSAFFNTISFTSQFLIHFISLYSFSAPKNKVRLSLSCHYSFKLQTFKSFYLFLTFWTFANFEKWHFIFIIAYYLQHKKTSSIQKNIRNWHSYYVSSLYHRDRGIH